MPIYNSAEELIGNTPMLRLKSIEKHFDLKAKLYAKLEYLNPAGSIKDRAAKAMIDKAEQDGILTPDSVIIEPTSGNTGIGLASISAQRGYRAIIVMPETMSEERKKLMRAYGAELVLTDGSLGMTGAIKKAEELAREIPNSFIPAQFDNPENAQAHRSTTGPEIYSALEGKIDILVAGVGTGGTITGIGEYLKAQNENIKIVAVEPTQSPYLSQGIAGAHKLQGIGAGFIPKVLNTKVYDEVICVHHNDAYATGRLMGTKQGILVGISSGAALSASIEVAKRPENEGKSIVVILPDSGDRYLSTEMYE